MSNLPARQVTIDSWRVIEAIAPTMHAARLFGVNSPQQAAAIMLKGFELGLGLAASFELVHVVNGKPTLSPRGALALIHRSGELAKLEIDEQSDRCTVTMRRTNGVEFATSFSLDDAKRAGVVKPDSAWQSYPANMLRWRAVGFCADVVFPDILGGLKRADELGANITEQGDVIEGQWAEPAPPEVPAALVTLDDLVQQFPPEAILAANGGKLPGTNAEVAAVAATLNGATA